MTSLSIKSLLLAGTAAFALTGAAAAQTAAPSSRLDEPAPASQANAATAHGKPIQQIRSDLQKAGYSDIQVAPASILVNAKNKAGEPVTMLIGPNSITEVTAVGDGTTNGAKPMQVAQSGAMTPREGRSVYVSVPPTDRLSSNLVGLDIYNGENKDIGTIKDIAWGQDGIKAYIVSVGGFLGMDDRYIAVDPSAVKVSYDSGSKKWQAKMEATADQLKAAPEFKYSGAWAASKM